MIKILIAEDDSFLANAYKTKLLKEGFEIKVASEGQEALKILESFVPDIVVLDLIMPNLDGFSVLSRLRSQDKYKNLPILVASNLGQKEDIDKALSMGANGYIIKSDITMASFIDKIRKLTNKI